MTNRPTNRVHREVTLPIIVIIAKFHIPSFISSFIAAFIVKILKKVIHVKASNNNISWDRTALNSEFPKKIVGTSHTNDTSMYPPPGISSKNCFVIVRWKKAIWQYINRKDSFLKLFIKIRYQAFISLCSRHQFMAKNGEKCFNWWHEQNGWREDININTSDFSTNKTKQKRGNLVITMSFLMTYKQIFKK